jgi:hypothetical protein
MSSGYLCIAQNGEYDYLRMAYLQALSCKLTQNIVNNFSVIVDAETAEQITDNHREVFDKIIVLKNDLAQNSKIKMQNEKVSPSPLEEQERAQCPPVKGIYGMPFCFKGWEGDRPLHIEVDHGCFRRRSDHPCIPKKGGASHYTHHKRAYTTIVPQGGTLHSHHTKH